MKDKKEQGVIEQVQWVQGKFTRPDGIALNYRYWDNVYEGLVNYRHPFLLLHGLASGLRIWDKVAVELVKRTAVQVLTLDQRGHGLSDKPDSGYTTSQIVEDDHLFADYARDAEILTTTEPPVVVGHSWGATIALAYAATYPDEVAGLVLVDGGMGSMRNRPGYDDWEKVSRELAPPDFAGTPKEKFLGFYRNGPQGRFLAGSWDEQLEDMVLNIVELREDGTVGPRLSRANHMQILRSMWEDDNLAYAAQVRCPVLMISAETTSSPDVMPDDARQAEWLKMKREGAAQLKSALVHSPKAEFVIMSETVHDIPLQRPAELAKLIVKFFAA
jgi:pimeloyl-ACP methyl ester carboxylesterase